MSKRARTGGIVRTRVIQVSQKRPIDKNLKVITKTGVDATQVATTLITATFPCTVTGIRQSLSFSRTAGAATCFYHWAIVLVRDGNSANALAVSDAATLYEPEQNVLAFGNGSLVAAGPDAADITGSTKTMRKLMGSDVLVFVAKGVATNTVDIQGVIQFFCKSQTNTYLPYLCVILCTSRTV